MIFSVVQFCRKLTYLIESRRLAAKSESGEKRADLAPNGVMQLALERHFTATAYILENGRALLLKHPKLGKWLPPGGHVEPNETPPECAKREAREETGLRVELIPQENLWLNYSNAASFERPYLCLLENIP